MQVLHSGNKSAFSVLSRTEAKIISVLKPT